MIALDSTQAIDVTLLLMSRIEDEGPSDVDVPTLIRQAKTGDLAAFESLLKLHEHLVFRIAFGLLQSREDAQDAAQEVYLRLYKHLRRFDPEREFTPWLYRVTINVCRSLNRRRSRSQAFSLDSWIGENPAREPASESPHPLEAFDLEDRRRRLALALSRLGEMERAALLLRDSEGLTARQAGEILGSSEKTVRSQISRARQKLRTILGTWREGAK